MPDEQEPLGLGPRRGILATLLTVARALEAAEAPFLVGGSLASSLQGIPRSTQDVDLVADLAVSKIAVFVRALGSGFYVDEERIRHGIERRTCFNVIDLGNGFKADIYLAPNDPFGEAQYERRQAIELAPGTALPFASPEDVVLQKLRWYRLGGGVSERQWLDALGVLKIQRERLDLDYLSRWAATLELSDMLARALAEAGLENHESNESGGERER